jgi:hypothetical protein
MSLGDETQVVIKILSVESTKFIFSSDSGMYLIPENHGNGRPAQV